MVEQPFRVGCCAAPRFEYQANIPEVFAVMRRVRRIVRVIVKRDQVDVMSACGKLLRQMIRNQAISQVQRVWWAARNEQNVQPDRFQIRSLSASIAPARVALHKESGQPVFASSTTLKRKPHVTAYTESWCIRGSSASRNPSPTKVKASVRIVRARIGDITSCG